MKRVFSHTLTALITGFFFRLFFLLRLPSTAGDTALYETLSLNWVKHSIYGMPVDGVLAPVDIRMPGYPAYLALVQAFTNLNGEAARFWVMLGQVFLDLACCIFIAELASHCSGRKEDTRKVYLIALWLAALCPFTANYTAVPLTETFTMFWTALALTTLVPMVNPEQATGELRKWGRFPQRSEFLKNAFWAGVCVGFATLFRPESPLLLVACLPVVLWMMFFRGQFARGLWAAGLACVACFLVLLPWTVRNAVTLHEVQPLTPRYTTLPGERAPVGFMSWEKTWLYRFREVFLVSWKMNDETIQIDDIPARAFDSPEERQHVAAILEQYNQDSNLTAEQDAQFASIAQGRTERHPLRTYVWIPLQRVVTLWFTPRIEQLPISGSIFPLAHTWQTDRLDMSATLALFFINIFYVVCALWGAVRMWRCAPETRAAVALLALFVLVRTAFLTTVETPEPRYVLLCFPAVIALAAHGLLRGKLAQS
ncbi:MAG TPA: hypothetical protein VFR42_01570, partial [Candidatus Acidoferrum sp.]|nr:hypothetical protein [Candidatus Acidoferrum sp.]